MKQQTTTRTIVGCILIIIGVLLLIPRISFGATSPNVLTTEKPILNKTYESGLACLGDRIDDAYLIQSIPFFHAGASTEYFNDDYDEICPYDAPGSPDVVYAYTPSTTCVLDFSMYGSSYDTKLYIYENAEGNLIACNDDYYADWTSAIFGITLTEENTYYIVVDGYGGDYGPYYLSIDIHEEVDPGYCHQPSPNDGSWAAYTSAMESPYVCLDDFYIPGAEMFAGVQFWGLLLEYDNGWYTCYEDRVSFIIAFWGSTLDEEPYALFFVEASPVSTGENYAGFPLYEFNVEFDDAIPLSDTGWIAIANMTEDCWFLWMNSSGGDGLMYQLEFVEGEEDPIVTPIYDDLAFCLFVEGVGINEPVDLPTNTATLYNYPNPFNATTTIEFNTPSSGDAIIEIYNIIGQKVDAIFIGTIISRSTRIEYNPHNLSSGVYFYSLKINGEHVKTQRFNLIK